MVFAIQGIMQVGAPVTTLSSDSTAHQIDLEYLKSDPEKSSTNLPVAWRTHYVNTFRNTAQN